MNIMYGGTKEEMERLLKDAEKLTGKKYKLSSYADIVEAIHAIQTEMGITGTTAEEASKTISGSIGMLKSAWENLITGMGEGNEVKLDGLVNAVVDAGKTVFANIMPVAEKVIYGFIHLIEASVPVLLETVPGMVSRLAPRLVKAAGTLVTSIGKSLPSLMSSIVKKLPQALKKVERFLLVWVFGTMGRLLSNLAGYKIQTDQSIFQNVFSRVMDLLRKIADKAKEFWKVVVQPIVQDGAKLIQVLVRAVIHLLDGLKPIWDEVSPKISEAFQAIADFWHNTLYPVLDDIVFFVITWLVPRIIEWVGKAVDFVGKAFVAIGQFWSDTLYPALSSIWQYITVTLIPAVVKAWNEDFLPTIQTVFQAVAGFWEDTLKPALVALYDYVWRDLIPTLIVAWEYTLQPAIERVFGAIAGFWEETLKPAFVAIYDYVVRDLIPTLIVWFEYYLGPAIEGVFKGIKEWWDTYGADAFGKFLQVVQDIGGYVSGAFKTAIDFMIDNFDTLLPIVTGLVGAFVAYKAAITISTLIDAVRNSTTLLTIAQTALNAVMNANPIAIVVSVLGGLATALITAYNTNDEFKQKVDAAWQAVKTAFDKYVKPVGDWIGDTFVKAWEGLQTAIGNVISFLQGDFSTNWQTIWEKLVGWVSTPFNTLGEILKTPINAVIDLLNGMIRSVRDAVNTVIGFINNTLKISIPSISVDANPLSPNFGVHVDSSNPAWSWSANLPTIDWDDNVIQHLANGGILGEGQSAFVGEYAPELLRVIGGKAMVTPLSKVPARFPGGPETFEPRVAKSRPVTVIMQVGEKEFGRLAFELGSAEEQRVGVKLAKGGAY